ncbi:MAG: alpha/beta hydrolase [Thalassobaculum sp.]|uniref:alpha/beta hydrolase n=1 Tax=Thalassobaculum sp. TaxID=2022740 RepID=UPI0032EB4BE0
MPSPIRPSPIRPSRILPSRILQRLLRLPVLLALALLPACSGADLLNALVPDEGYRVIRDLRYAAGPRRGADVYIPDGADPGSPAPVVVFLYGGGWHSGSRDDYRFVGEALASRGFVAVIPDYRLYPEVRWPAFLEDSAAAVAWTRAGADGNLRPGRPVLLAGHSAGAYNAAMLTLDPQWLAAVGERPCRAIAATAGLAGPYDFLPLTGARLKAIFGPEEQRPRTQPVNHVDGTAPPMLLIAGTDDTTVLPRNSERLARRIGEAGGRAELRRYDGVGHVELVASLARPLQGSSPALDDMVGFFRAHPAPAGCGRGVSAPAPPPGGTSRRSPP